MIPGTKVEQAKSKVKAVIDSSNEVRVGWAKVGLLLVVVAVAWSAFNHVYHRKTGDPWFGISPPVVRAAEAATVAPTVEVTPTIEAQTVLAAQVEYVEVVVTATPTVVPPTPIVEVQYYEIPVEVTRIVEVTAVPLPTPTVLPLAPGVVEVCLRVEGAREIYVGGVGVVSGACQKFSFGIGQTTITVQVNK